MRVVAAPLLAACVLFVLDLTTSLQLPTRPAIKVAVRPTSKASVRPIVVPPVQPETSWPLASVAFSLLPLAAGSRRKTLETTVVPGQVWTHDQLQGIVNVNVPVRSTVVKLKEGGLWVHNPVAPTPEYLGLIQALEAAHGPVKHIVLGTVGLEHKALAGPFSRCFPEAQVWIQPGQWSFPVPLPNFLFGFPLNARPLPTAAEDARARAARAAAPQSADAAARADLYRGNRVPWRNEINFEVLGPLNFKAVGAFSESAFVHAATGTLIVTDTVVKIDAAPPAILSDDPRALLFHARDAVGDEVVDDEATRARGWRRIVLFGLLFFPSAIVVEPLGAALLAALGLDGENDDSSSSSKTRGKSGRPPTAEMRALGEGAVPLGLYPWTWVEDAEPSFKALQQSGGNAAGLLVAPVLRNLILDREPEAVLAWADRVANMGFSRVVPCHLANNVKASPSDFRRAFSFLEAPSPGREPSVHSTSEAAPGGEVAAVLSNMFAWMQGGEGSRNSETGAVPSAKAEDLVLLETVSDILTKLGVVAPSRVSSQRCGAFTGK